MKDAEPILSYVNILEPSAHAYADGLDLKDPRVSTSVRLYRKLDEAGAEPVLDLYEGMWHVFQADLVPEGETSVKKSAEFIATKLAAAKQ